MSELAQKGRFHQVELKGERALWALELDACESTQDSLWAIDERELKGGSPLCHLLYTLDQRGGRGRRGRAWLAPPGACLCVSWRLSQEGIAQEHLWALSFAGGLAVADVVSALGVRCALKWPNDVLVAHGTGHRKLAGVLCEARISALSERGDEAHTPRVMLGVGLNLTAHPEGFKGAASLSELIEGGLPSPQTLVERLSERLFEVIELLTTPSVKTEGASALIAQWRAHSLPIGTPLRQADIKGSFAGVTDQGALLLDTPSGSVSIETGEVTLVGDVADLKPRKET